MGHIIWQTRELFQIFSEGKKLLVDRRGGAFQNYWLGSKIIKSTQKKFYAFSIFFSANFFKKHKTIN